MTSRNFFIISCAMNFFLALYDTQILARTVQFIRVELDVIKGWLTITKEGRYPCPFFHAFYRER